MKHFFARSWLPAALCMGVMFTPVAHAQLAQNLLIGNAKAISLGNAVTADPPGIDSIHFNPAGLAKIKGRQVQLKFIAGSVDIWGEFSSNERYNELLEEFDLVDSTMADQTSEVDNFAFYMPGSGITELPVIAAPLGGMAYNLPDTDMTFGSAVYAPLILGLVREKDDPGRFYGREMGLTRLTYFSPTIGWQLTEKLAVGAGIGFSYFGVGLSLDYRAPNVLLGGFTGVQGSVCDPTDPDPLFGPDAPLDLCAGALSPFESLFVLEVDLENYFSPTINLGLLWEPYEWLSLGVVYQSQAADRLEGDVAVLLDEQVVGLFDNLSASTLPILGELIGGFIDILEITKDNGEIRSGGQIDLKIPQHFAVGASIQLTPRVKFNIDWKWTETSVWQEFDFKIDEALPLLQLLQAIGISGVEPNAIVIPREYENASNFGYGLEYQYSNQIALRLGYEPRKSGIPDNKRDFLIPLGDFDLWGVGAEYKWSKDTVIDLAIAYAKSDQYIPTGSSTNGNLLWKTVENEETGEVREVLEFDNFVYNPSAGLDVRSVLEALLFEFSVHTVF